MPTLQRTHINRRIPLPRTPLIKLTHINPIPPHRLRTQLPQLQPLLKHPHRLPITKHLHLPSPHKHRNKKRFNKSLLIKHRIFKVFIYFSIKADNIKDPKEVTVTFGEDEEVDAEALADTTITLTDAEGNAIPAKFSKLDKDGNAIYKAEEELTDAVKYTVTSEDLAIAKDTKVTAKVAPVYIADVTFLTTGVKEINETQEIQLVYKDQYGESIDLSKVADKDKTSLIEGLKVTAQKENTSLMLDVKFKEASKDIVVLTIKPQQLKENDTFTVTITNEVEKEDKKELVLNKESEPIKVYAADAKVVATSLTKPVVTEAEKEVDGETVKYDPTEDLKSGDSFDLTTTVYDQFSNKMENLAAGATEAEDAPVLQWQTSDPEVLALGSKDKKAKAVNGKNSTDFGMKIFAGKQGEATITVSTPDGLYSETFTVEVGQGKLASIVANNKPVKVENKAKADGLVSVNEVAEDIKDEDKEKHPLIKFQNSNNSNIKVKAKDIDFEVEEKKDSEFKVSDVTLEKVVDEEGYLTGVKVSTDRKALTEDEKKGNYEKGHDYTVKVKPANEKSEVEPAKFTVNSTINSEVTAIETATDVEFRAGSEMTPEEVTFKNKYGEIINVQAKNLEVTYSKQSKIDATLQTKTVEKGEEPTFTEIDENSTELVHAIKYSSGEKKDATVNVILAIDKVSKLVNVKVNESAAIASIDLGEDVKDLIAGKEATLLPVTVKDQDGNVKNVEKEELNITVNPEIDKQDVFTLVPYGKDKDGKLVEIPEENTKNIKALGVAVKVDTESLEDHSTTTYEVTVDNNTEVEKDLVKDTIEVTIQANPALKVFNVSTETPTMTTNGEIEVLIKPEDQYGEFIKLAEDNNYGVKINEDAEYVELGEVTAVKETVKGKDGQEDSTKVVAYKAILKAKGKDGSETVEFTIGNKDNKVAAQKLDVTVTGLDKVTEVEVVADQDEYITADKEQEVQLTAIGKDEEGNQVALEANGLTWTIEKVVDAEGNEYKLDKNGKYTFTPEDGKTETLDVSIDENGKLKAPQGASVSVTVKSETNALVAGEKTITFKGDPRKFVEGLKVGVFCKIKVQKNATKNT